MNTFKIVALFGEAGSGKDFLQKQIMRTDFGKENLSEIISCTTRPPREGELDGVHYHFIQTAAELINKDLIEYSIFRDWWYGTPIDSLDINKINIGVFNINGIDQLINHDHQHRIDCLPIRIKCIDKIRLIRQLNRESNPDCLEICRRFQTDTKDFLNIPFSYKVIENNTDEINPIINEIKDLIIDKWSELNKTY
jgi:guanylate kinase